MSHRDLLQRVAERDTAAFEELYLELRARLQAFLLRLTGSAAEAEELLNDVMLVVWRKAGEFEGRSAVSTWVFGIAYRKAMKAIDKRRRRGPSVALEDVELTEGPRAERRLERSEIRDRLRKSLDELSIDHRAVIELTYYFGYSYREIGEIVGCPENTVKTRMFHARRRLKPLLSQLRPSEAGTSRQGRQGV